VNVGSYEGGRLEEWVQRDKQKQSGEEIKLKNQTQGEKHQHLDQKGKGRDHSIKTGKKGGATLQKRYPSAEAGKRTPFPS